MTGKEPKAGMGARSISVREGHDRLMVLLAQGETLLRSRPLQEGQVDIWSTSCLQVLQDTYGKGSRHCITFHGPPRVTVLTEEDIRDAYAERREVELLERRCGVLRGMLKQMEVETGFLPAPAEPVLDFWSDMHPRIVSVAKPRFESGQFADAVEAALKEVNAVIKEHVRQKTGAEMDGADLMHKAFSPGNPIVVLGDLSTETGRNIQQGYMEIYAGVMTGIRNPKAHANIQIDGRRARHHLYVASLLMHRFDERA